GPGLGYEYRTDRQMARVPEFQDEGNNITAAPLEVMLSTPPDLQVTQVVASERVVAGQNFEVRYTVANMGSGPTPGRQNRWDDLIYLSRDQFLDLSSDRFLTFRTHQGVLQPGESYEIVRTLRAPVDLDGPYYVFVITDPVKANQPRGKVFEGAHEQNNATPSAAMVIEQPPPTDLQVTAIVIPNSARTGETVRIEWTVTNVHSETMAQGTWTDAVYLSTDAVWDISDRLIGRVPAAPPGGLEPGESYTSVLETTLPPATPGQYRIIVRADIFNEVFEGEFTSNNTTPSPDVLNVTVDPLHLGVPLETTLSTGQQRLYQIDVGLGETLRVQIESNSPQGANELFLRHGDLPTGVAFDAASRGPIAPDQTVVIPSTEPGSYFLLVQGHSQPAPNTQVTLLAEVLPLSIFDVTPDAGGSSRWVTTTIVGAQFHPDALVKLVRPGFAEYEPTNYAVLDSTTIIATFDLRQAPHGLYDVKVVNPNGDQAVVPYRYLIERAIETDVTIGMGGPRILAPGDTGLYGVSLKSLTNVDTPYVHFTFGLPELGINESLAFGDDPGLRYVVFASNLRGAPDAALAGVPWASLDSAVNTTGDVLAPGFVFDLPVAGFAGRTLTAQTYPGLAEILEQDPQFLARFAEEDRDDEVAFQFYIVAAATALNREDFVAMQTEEALRLREAILSDPTAAQALVVLAADPEQWTTLYLAALEEAGLLRPENDVPPIRQQPLVVSLMGTLATGILAGPAGEQIATEGDLLSFFEQVRGWYGHAADLIGSAVLPERSEFDLDLSRPTHFEAFNIYVPFAKARPELPPSVEVPPPQFGAFLAGEAAGIGSLARMIGPFGFGNEQFLPARERLPYTVHFENASTASSHVSELQIVTELDPDLDPRTFRLGDIRLGEITVHVPDARGSLQADFDFTQQLGFILRVSAGLDPISGTATWLLQAIDPDTGERVQNPFKGFLPPNNAQGAGAGFVSYSIVPRANLETGTEIAAQARVLFNNAPPEDTELIVQRIDGVAPTTTVTATPLVSGGSDFQVEWTAVDDEGGSGVQHVTVYVAEDGGEFQIWLRQTTDTAAVYQGRAGHTYEFLALATDNAGNRELPPRGMSTPDDGSRANVGALPDVGQTAAPDPGTPPPASPQPSTNPLFVEALAGIPSAAPATRPSEFSQVLRPFTGQAFVTGIPSSHAGIGPLAIVELPSGSVLLSGGPARNLWYHFGLEGGQVMNPVPRVDHPVFDLAYDESRGTVWAATGGGPLLQLHPASGRILSEHGDGLTQTLAVDPATGLIYVSSGTGIEVFDPAVETFTRFSDMRVGNLRFAPDGTLWAASWPDRGTIVRFDHRGRPEAMLAFDSAVDSIAFGQPGTRLEDLLFVSHNSGPHGSTGGILTMVDMATLRRVTIATGGTRGDIVQTTSDGRVLLSQSHQVDVIAPILAPRVAATNPPHEALVALPRGQISVTFDQAMLVGSASDPASVLNPSHYTLVSQTIGPVDVAGLTYDAASFTVLLDFDALQTGSYTLTVDTGVRSMLGLELAEAYAIEFTAISDFSPFVDVQFANSRSERTSGTVSFDVTVTNQSDHDLVLPLLLVLDPHVGVEGRPLGAVVQQGSDVWLVDLAENVPPDGVLKPGDSTTGRTVTILNPGGQRIDFDIDVYTLAFDNAPPVFTSQPLTQATADQPYAYQAVAVDPDGIRINYVLVRGPEGMRVDPDSGLVLWEPTSRSPADADVVLRAYDSRGGHGEQRFAIQVDGGNRAPVFTPLPATIVGREGQPLIVPLSANDPDGDDLVYWIDDLPPGAAFDPQRRALVWTPGFEAAGTYENVRLVASDGLQQAVQTVTILIAPVNQPPRLVRPADRTVNEGEMLRIVLEAEDADGDVLRFSSSRLPGGAVLYPHTGVFTWTPAFFQAGIYEIPFTVSDGTSQTTQTTTFTVLNVNAPPVFDRLDRFVVQEGQELRFRAFAFDPDNPTYVPPDRMATGELTPLDDTPPTVSYTVDGLPAGAAFDPETLEFSWIPDFDQAGEYFVTFTATDDGDGTGVPLSDTVIVPITVRNTNRAPVIEAVAPQTVARDQVLEIPIVAVDPDGNPLEMTATGLPGFPIPDFMTFTHDGQGSGLLHVAPGFGDRGDHAVTITATDDGDGGGPRAALSSTFTFVVTVDSPNEPPRIAHLGDRVAVVDQPLQFTVRASDLDEDDLSFATEGLPSGATLTPGLVYGTAIFLWTPAETDLGEHPITVTVTDSGNGDSDHVLSDSASFRIVVRNSNAAPVLAPIGDQQAQEGEPFHLQLSASDPDGDPLTYSAVNLPSGAALDPVTGQLSWTPNLFQAGVYEGIHLAVTDGNLTSGETIRIVVANTNQPPVLTPLPDQSGREGTLLQFTVTATDIDGDPVLFASPDLPAGASLGPQSGLFHWTPDFEQAGEYLLTFTAEDPHGARDSMEVLVRIDNVNRPPSLTVSSHSVPLGETLEFALLGSDPDLGTVLVYSAEGLPPGATLDSATGLVTWTPSPGQTGDYTVTYDVSDGEFVVRRSAILRATLVPELPRVHIELTPSFPPIPGQTVLVHAIGDSLSGIVGRTITVDGQTLVLDQFGRAEFVPAAPGKVLVEATATDADGRTGTASTVIKIRDPSDDQPPAVSFAPGLNRAMFSSPADIVATVSDLNLDQWMLEISRAHHERFVLLARGDSVVEDASLFELDPALLPNGFYVLRLTATDIAGRSSRVEIAVEVNSSVKAARYLRSETDLAVELDGIGVELVRSYDSLLSDRTQSFGLGWRLAHRDVNLETDVAPTGREHLGVYSPYLVGTRLYLTLPDNRRVGFTFTPQRHETTGLTYYTPAWTADPGVEYQLDSVDTLLTRAGSRLYDLTTARPYNPASGGWEGARLPSSVREPHRARPYNPASGGWEGPQFTLAAPDGAVYHLSVQKGIEAVVTSDGARLIYSDSGIIGPGGQRISFERDALGRITTAVAPDGSLVIYRYDDGGRLVDARQLAA
ncbi:MAG: tandem-95 repeat protein, partial [Planctomycetaceae bacterium]